MNSLQACVKYAWSEGPPVSQCGGVRSHTQTQNVDDRDPCVCVCRPVYMCEFNVGACVQQTETRQTAVTYSAVIRGLAETRLLSLSLFVCHLHLTAHD